MSNICGFSLINVKICCFSLSYMTVYEGSFGLGLFVGQKKPFEEVTLGSRKL